jgi:uncharacterized protein
MTFHVYVVELDKPATGKKGFLYVGSSAHIPEERYRRHKEGGRFAVRVVTQHGKRLRRDLYSHLPAFEKRHKAEREERRLANQLRAKGYFVKVGTRATARRAARQKGVTDWSKPLPLWMRRRVLRLAKEQFRIAFEGDHGGAHWARVRRIGLKLAPLTGAKIALVELFALLHDSQRFDEWEDPQHGPRAAAFVRSINSSVLKLTDDDLALLAEACDGHSDGRRSSDPTIGTCWDADRLDLGRIGIDPDAEYLSTEAAKDPGLMDWAYKESIKWRAARRRSRSATA